MMRCYTRENVRPEDLDNIRAKVEAVDADNVRIFIDPNDNRKWYETARHTIELYDEPAIYDSFYECERDEFGEVSKKEMNMYEMYSNAEGFRRYEIDFEEMNELIRIVTTYKDKAKEAINKGDIEAAVHEFNNAKYCLRWINSMK